MRKTGKQNSLVTYLCNESQILVFLNFNLKGLF